MKESSIFETLIEQIVGDEGVLLAQQGPGYLNAAVLHHGEGVGIVAALMVPGWLTLMAPAISYEQGLNAEMIGQIFTDSAAIGPLKFVLAGDGLYLKLDVPLALGASVWLAALKRLGRAVHALYDHDPAWMAPPYVKAADPVVLGQWLMQNTDKLDAELVEPGQWRLEDTTDPKHLPVVMEVDDTLGLVRLMCGIVQLDEDQFDPARYSDFLRMNDRIVSGKLVAVKRQNALMYMMDIPSDWVKPETLSVYWAQLLTDQLTLRAMFVDVAGAFESATTHLQTEARRVGLEDSVLARNLLGLAQGTPFDAKIEADEALSEAMFGVAEYIFQVVPRIAPQVMALLPMQLDDVVQGRKTLDILPSILAANLPSVERV